jgi:hypothetical protein
VTIVACVSHEARIPWEIAGPIAEIAHRTQAVEERAVHRKDARCGACFRTAFVVSCERKFLAKVVSIKTAV